MFVKIAKYTFFGFITLLVLLWILGGGISKSVSIAKSFSNPVQIMLNPKAALSSFSTFKLPGQPNNLGLGVNALPGGIPDDISQLTPSQPGQDTQTQDTRTFGQQSAYHGRVTLQQGNTSATSVSQQHLVVSISSGNVGAVNFDGWSLQSVLSGTRIFLPQAASPYILGAVNAPSTIFAEPGNTLIVSSGASPIGVSFHETICTGYLNELFVFSPQLSNTQCPGAIDAHNYGLQCATYASMIPTCHFPHSLPSALSPQCRTYLGTTLSYRGCTDRYQRSPQFFSNSWRIYLGSSGPVWRTDHDTIRLLDQNGRIVDSLSY